MERVAAQGNWRKREIDIARVADRDSRARHYRRGWPVAQEAMPNARTEPASAPDAPTDRPSPADSTRSVQE